MDKDLEYREVKKRWTRIQILRIEKLRNIRQGYNNYE